jgi:hypothetical protein
MDDTPLDAGATAPGTASGGGPPGGSPAGAEGKECVFCGEAIAAFADRCSHCGGFLPIAEGRSFSQHYFFFVCCLALFLGTLLPWEGMWWDSYGFRSIHGAFLLLFSTYGMVAFFFNVFHRRMVVWPAMLGALDGAYAGWHRVAQLAGSDFAKAIEWGGDLGAKKKALLEFCRLFGPGLWLVVIFSSLFWVLFVVSVVRGGMAAGARKEAEKAARMAKRKPA